ncbi:hypothetical protein [Nocardia nepalensis]|uniref:hypothetical protein n=1 Tax=Nocardia nepalensis TaxID=3375448 RepID=UPI003B67817F
MSPFLPQRKPKPPVVLGYINAARLSCEHTPEQVGLPMRARAERWGYTWGGVYVDEDTTGQTVAALTRRAAANPHVWLIVVPTDEHLPTPTRKIFTGHSWVRVVTADSDDGSALIPPNRVSVQVATEPIHPLIPEPGCATTDSPQVKEDPLIILDTDIGYDPDDFVTLIIAAQSVANLAVVTADETRGRRAELARHVLDLMDRSDVAVIPGIDIGGEHRFVMDEFIDRPTEPTPPPTPTTRCSTPPTGSSRTSRDCVRRPTARSAGSAWAR